jgi:zinc/manganese transport system substrate-binding protein
MRQIIFTGLFSLVGMVSITQADTIKVVAAENFYGDIALQIGDANVAVTSILNNPNQDPHLFEVSPSVGRDVSAARIVIYNGINYDPWMEKLLAAARSANRRVIVVAELIGKKTGDNPHIWYDPATMLALAKAFSHALIAEDPAHETEYEHRLVRFRASIKPIQAKIDELHRRCAGMQVTATEPVFGYIEPSASGVAAFENDLKTHQVKLLIYNSQASYPIAARMQKIAGESGVPVVGAAETEPPGKDYQGWMMSELDAIDRALSKQTP